MTSSSSRRANSVVWFVLLLVAVAGAAGIRAVTFAQAADGPLPRVHEVPGTSAHAYHVRITGEALEAARKARAESGAEASAATEAPKLTVSAGGPNRQKSALRQKRKSGRAQPSKDTAPAEGGLGALQSLLAGGAENLDLDALMNDPEAALGALAGGVEQTQAPNSNDDDDDGGGGAPSIGDQSGLPGIPGAGGPKGDILALIGGGDDTIPTALDTAPVPRWIESGLARAFGQSPLVRIIFQLALGAASILLIALIARRIFDPTVGAVTALAAAASATIIGPELILGPGPLVLFLLLLAVTFLQTADDERILPWVCAGSTIAALGLTDTWFAPLILFMIIAARFSRVRIGDRMKPSFPILLGVVIVTAPALIANFDAMLAGGIGGLMAGVTALGSEGNPITLLELIGRGEPAAPLPGAALQAEAPILQFLVVAPIIVLPLACVGMLFSGRLASRPGWMLLALAVVIGRVLYRGPDATDRVLLLVLVLPWAAEVPVLLVRAFSKRPVRATLALGSSAMALSCALILVPPAASASQVRLEAARLLVNAADRPREREAMLGRRWADAAQAMEDAVGRYPDPATLDEREARKLEFEIASLEMRQVMYLRQSGDGDAAREVQARAQERVRPKMPQAQVQAAD